jgi:hypothetical protein
VTEGDLAPGGIASFGVIQGPGSITIDHVNAGTGTQSITVVGVPMNAVINIPPFVPGTFNPVVVTFTRINPALPVNFTLRAASTFHAANIRVRCGIPGLNDGIDEGIINSDGDAMANWVDPDDDNDGVLDTADNYQLTFNANQADFERDGIGERAIRKPDRPLTRSNSKTAVR